MISGVIRDTINEWESRIPVEGAQWIYCLLIFIIVIQRELGKSMKLLTEQKKQLLVLRFDTNEQKTIPGYGITIYSLAFWRKKIYSMMRWRAAKKKKFVAKRRGITIPIVSLWQFQWTAQTIWKRKKRWMHSRESLIGKSVLESFQLQLLFPRFPLISLRAACSLQSHSQFIISSVSHYQQFWIAGKINGGRRIEWYDAEEHQEVDEGTAGVLSMLLYL